MSVLVTLALGIAVLLLAAGCERGRTEGTRRMVERLARIADSTDASPRGNAYANWARVREIRRRVPPNVLREQLRYNRVLAQELLFAGDNQAAIDRFRMVIDSVEKYPDMFVRGYKRAIRDYLAISYMRLGEQENCIDNHNIDRCLFPIQGAGVYDLQRGPREAIKIYEQLLAEDPADMNALWLLNVAYQTVGAYPDSVPAEWLIPPSVFESDYDIGRFPDVAPLTGLDVVGLSGGVVMEDLNGDALLDIMVSSWGLRDQLEYFVNNGDGTFTNRTQEAGLEGIVSGLNLIHADYDNDGDNDVLLLRGAWMNEGHPNSLLRNRGNGVFDDVTEEAGLLSFHPTQTAAWGDYDGDGLLDLFVGNESNQWAGVNRCALFHNNGDGTFTDVAPEVGLDIIFFAKSVSWGDYDNDGRPDLFISSWVEPNLLFRNEGPGPDGRWRFSEVGGRAGVRAPAESFPGWWWDYDNDGWLDIFVSGWRASSGQYAADVMGRAHSAELPRLYRNRGDGSFEDVTAERRLDKVLFTMGTNFGDLDNDGWLDFYAGTGDPDYRSLMPNRMFRNAEGRYFQEVTASGGFGHLQKGHGIAFGDLDNDGDQDIYEVMGGAFEGDVFPNVLFENPGHGNRWITLFVEGRRSNRSAIGTRIEILVDTPGGERSIHAMVGTGATFGSSSLRQEIGLGDAIRIRHVELFWPATGERQRVENVPMDEAIRVVEGESGFEVVSLPAFDLSPRGAVPRGEHDHSRMHGPDH